MGKLIQNVGADEAPRIIEQILRKHRLWNKLERNIDVDEVFGYSGIKYNLPSTKFAGLFLSSYISDIKVTPDEDLPMNRIVTIDEVVEFPAMFEASLQVTPDHLDVIINFDQYGRLVSVGKQEVNQHFYIDEEVRAQLGKYFKHLKRDLGANFAPIFERMVEVYKIYSPKM